MTAPSVLTVLLLVLLLLNGLALVRSRGGPLTQAPVSALLLALLLVASLPLSPEALPTALLLTTLLGGGAIAFAVMPRRGIPLESGTLRFVVTAVGLALLSGLLLALRPSPFEYPGDSVDYLNTFQRLALQGSESSSCLNQTWSRISYWRECTLWRVLMQVSPHSLEALLSGWPQRTTIALEMAVLGMSCFRLLRCSGVGPLTAGLSWLLIVFGLGNQAIAFVVNNALQGSILAAAVFVEACLLLVWWAGRAWPSLPQVLVLPLGLAPILYLELKLHGAFALTTLALLLPLPLLLGLHTLRLAPSRRLLPRRTAMLLLLASLLLAGLLLAGLLLPPALAGADGVGSLMVGRGRTGSLDRPEPSRLAGFRAKAPGDWAWTRSIGRQTKIMALRVSLRQHAISPAVGPEWPHECSSARSPPHGHRGSGAHHRRVDPRPPAAGGLLPLVERWTPRVALPPGRWPGGAGAGAGAPH